MTRKDYVKFAKMLNNKVKEIDPVLMEYRQGKEAAMIYSLTVEIADIFEEDNERFDRGRFFNAVYQGKGIEHV